MEMLQKIKKNILNLMNQCGLMIKKNEENTQQIMNKLGNTKIQIDLNAFGLIDQVETYSRSLLMQINEHEETNSSSGYDSFNEQQSFE